MNSFDGLLRHIRAHWPAYAIAYGSLVAALLAIGFGLQTGRWELIPIGVAALTLVGYFLLTSLWAAHNLYDEGGINPHHILFDMGKIRAEERFVYIDLGLRHRPVSLARRLTGGQVVAVDIYTPQWMPKRPLARARAHAPAPSHDPRLSWQAGRIDLLPLPDESVKNVIVCQTAVEFWQSGDQLALFREIARILDEDGRLLLAERARTQTNWLVMGPMAAQLPTPDYWKNLLKQAGFRVRKETAPRNLIHCFRADKPTHAEARQLPLDI